MKIHVKKENIKILAPILFNLYNDIFIESYHTQMSTLETFIKDYEHASVFVAYDHKTPIGFLIFTDRENFIMLEEFGIIPNYQSKGIGSLLIKAFFKDIKKEMHVITNPHNSKAIIFYLKNGFEIAKWLEKYYNGEPWLLLKRHKTSVY